MIHPPPEAGRKTFLPEHPRGCLLLASGRAPGAESFDLYHPEGAGSVLEVHLMDKKQIGTDEPLGRGFVDLVDFLEVCPP